MKYTVQEVMQFVREEDVKFIRLAFCDVFGRQKNISVMAEDLDRAFEYGIAIDASAVEGFGGDVHSDLFLRPEPETLTVFPWRPEHGRVVRLFCNVLYPDGKPFENDTRHILKNAIAEAKKLGVSFNFGSETEFYLFKTDENGNPTKTPYDKGGYMDIAPDDKGENVRREICLTLERMGIMPETSHHEEGPGQNEIDFHYSDPLTAADNAITFKRVVKTVADRNGLYADFSPKPIDDCPGNGFHINVSVESDNPETPYYLIAGIMEKIKDMTAFLNPCSNSYDRLGQHKAPRYISWSRQNRSQLIRLPAATGRFKRAELRSPDPATNPYLAYALIIYAGIYGIKNKLPLPEAKDINFFTADNTALANIETLPATLEEARAIARESKFIKEIFPQMLIDAYCGNQ